VRRLIGRASKLAAVLCIAAWLLAPTASAVAHQAGLLVFDGEGNVTWVTVVFAEDQISGDSLLQRSGLQVSEVSFGGLGMGVCGIEGTGCDIAKCRQRVCQGPTDDDPYWQYFLGKSDGTWTAAPLGVSADKVNDGEIRAFIWSTHAPTQAAPSIAEVIDHTGQPAAEGYAVARFNADGSPRTIPTSSRSVPWTGIVTAAAAVTVCCAFVVLNRQRNHNRQ
jgi:hypothetical protein